VCDQCGTVGTHWFQPFIGLENFCGISCAMRWSNRHYTDATHKGHTLPCGSFAHAAVQS
jgi:hypothetical protein